MDVMLLLAYAAERGDEDLLQVAVTCEALATASACDCA